MKKEELRKLILTAKGAVEADVVIKNCKVVNVFTGEIQEGDIAISGDQKMCIRDSVWDVNPEGKTDEEIADEGLKAMESWMRELGLVMNIRELGVTEDMLPGIVKGTFILDGGYKVLTEDEIMEILKESM